jgi:hypothetical protein
MNVLLESGRINMESIFESTHKKAALVNGKFDELRSKNPTLQDRVGECSDCNTWQQQGEEEEIARADDSHITFRRIKFLEKCS